ncbi:MAG: LysM peptidoglycan-binding domain-containing protein [Anaerolineae bacterium]
MNVQHRSAVVWAWRLLSAGLLFMLAGCFRPASDAPQSEVIPTETPAGQPVTVPTDTPTVSDPGLPATATIVFEIVTPQPTNTSSVPSELPTVTQGFQSLPTLTPSLSADQVQPTETAAGSFALSGTPTIIFITPGSPLGFVTPDPVTPTATLSFDQLNTLAAITPTQTDDGSGTAIPTVTPLDACVYVVQGGDTLYQIAIDQDVTSAEIRAVNPQLTGTDPILQIGQELRMPREGCPDYVAPTGTRTPAAQSTTSSSAPEGSGDLYTVQSGDTLYAIALRFGTTVNAIVQANNLANADSLQVGQQLVIPTSSGN